MHTGHVEAYFDTEGTMGGMDNFHDILLSVRNSVWVALMFASFFLSVN